MESFTKTGEHSLNTKPCVQAQSLELYIYLPLPRKLSPFGLAVSRNIV